MTLRLSASAPSASCGTPQSHLTAFLDGDATKQQKIDCLKLLNVVLKNLNDPVKAAEPKYRQLKLDNAKVQAKLVQFPSAVSFLLAVGFARTKDGEVDVLRMDQVPSTSLVGASLVSDALQGVQIALSRLNPPASLKREAEVVPMEKLSEKQKARRLLEQKEQRERELAKEMRKKTSNLIKQDKYVRENDENWSSKPSAACGKSGSAISTFRDRHGE